MPPIEAAAAPPASSPVPRSDLLPDPSGPDTPRAILERIVAFPTVSSASNLDLIEWVEGWLDARGIASGRDPEVEGGKVSLFAHVGPEAPGGVLLSGHVDVVPVEGQDWSTDPWTLTERDGLLFGRGACDMKGFDALALWAMGEAAALHREGRLKRPLQLALTRDEEIGLLGAPPLIEAMAHLPRAEVVIVGEPTSMRVVTGHKGGTGYRVHLRGHEVHSSMLPEGVSAVMHAAELVHWINERNAEVQARVPDALAAAFDPPFTTFHVGTISGGTATNITARDCHFACEFRVVPGDDRAALDAAFRAACAAREARMREVHPNCFVDVQSRFSGPPFVPDRDGAAEMLARRLTGDNASHTVSYGTEAGHFQAAGYSTVVCGPGDIAQAHQADEFLSIEQLEAGEAFLRRLLGHLCED